MSLTLKLDITKLPLKYNLSAILFFYGKRRKIASMIPKNKLYQLEKSKMKMFLASQ